MPILGIQTIATTLEGHAHLCGIMSGMQASAPDIAKLQQHPLTR